MEDHEYSGSDESDYEDAHVPRLAADDPDEATDEFDKELQAALAAGLIKPSLVRPSSQKKTYINNIQGLEQKLEEISQPDLEWAERLDVTIDVTEYKTTGDSEDADQINVNDDFKRETLFYEQAKSSALWAVDKLHKAGIQTKRPEDYFAEMAKKDDHMKKLRQKMIVKAKEKTDAERNRKNFQMRKFGKKVQQAVTMERQKQKREMLKSVKDFQKGKTQTLEFLDDQKPGPQKRKSGDPKSSKLQKITQNMKTNNKRAHKNKKFGFGGKKRNTKSNNKESHSDVSGFKRNVHSNKKKTRPGKSRRAQNKKRA